MELFSKLDELPMPRPKGVFQVGASVGQELRYFQENGIQRGIFVEPLTKSFEALSLQCLAVPDYVAVNALCGSADGQPTEFFVASNNGESSSILEPSRHLDVYPHVTFNEKITMMQFSADSILTAVRHSNPEVADGIDLLFMDVQGAEMHVLKGASRLLQQVSSVYT